MWIFIMEGKTTLAPRVAVPSDKVICVKQVENTIFITVSTGEVQVDESENGNIPVPQVDVYKVKYSNEDSAIREMNYFFYAMQEGKNAFLFTNQPENFEF